MGTYIALVNWTDQGIRNVKEAPKRLAAARDLAKKHGCELQQFYLTMGAYDAVTLMEAPDDEAVARFALALGAAGNVRSTTLKAFPEETFKKLVGSL